MQLNELEQMLKEPVKKPNPDRTPIYLEHGGKRLNMHQWDIELGRSKGFTSKRYHRYKAGKMDYERIFS